MYSIASNGIYVTNMVGAWNMVATGSVLQTPVQAMSTAYDSVTSVFTSMYDSVASMAGEKIGTELSLTIIKEQIGQWLGEWTADIFGSVVADTLFGVSSTVGSTVASSSYGYAGTLASSIVNVIGIAYAIYQIAKLVVQLVFACTEEEVKLNMLKSQKLCTQPGTVGNYCSAKGIAGCIARKQAYCCFSSPLARIIQEQGRGQLGLSFGDPKNPTCDGIPVSQLKELDFNKIDFSEWIGMLMVSSHLPRTAADANTMFDKATVTKGKLPGTQNQNAHDRINSQTNGTDIDAVRQHLLNNL
jgi:conjugal transfer mating pair stabilization protein TraN